MVSRGSIIYLDFGPSKGREQRGMRPALVVSDNQYNEKSGLCLACPITSKQKGFLTEVLLPESCTTKGVILADQIKTIDHKTREMTVLEEIPSSTVDEVIIRLADILGIPE